MLQEGIGLGPYEIVEKAGAGGMGEVYRARDTRLERTVAIKVLPREVSASADFRARFLREARTISSLSHPNICTLFDVGQQDGRDYLVMEFLDGETLAERLKRGPLPTRDVVKIGIDIANALDRAHRQGVVHRDLKPGNVMLTRSGAKLMDFGLAKPLRPALQVQSLTATVADITVPGAPITQQGTLVGTFQYMAPEVLEGKPADARSDIFAFGCLLYEMASGRPAFTGKTQISVLSAILDHDPEPISVVHPASPQALDHIVRGAIAKDPDERWQSAHDVKVALEWMSHASSSALAAPALGTRRKIRMSTAVFAAFALLALLALAYVALRPAPVPRTVHASIAMPPKIALGGVQDGPVALSPDGQKLAFLEKQESTKLWIRDLSTGIARALDGTDDATYPFWSPDSKSLAFFSEGKLKRIAANGGPVQVIADAPNGRGGTWGSKGVIVYAPEVADALYAVSESGGTPWKVTARESSSFYSDRNPAFLPDGKHFLFTRMDTPTSGKMHAGNTNGTPYKDEVLPYSSTAAYSDGLLFSVKDNNLLAQPFDVSTLKISGNAFPIAQNVEFFSARLMANFSIAGPMMVYHSVPKANTQIATYDLKGSLLDTMDTPASFGGDHLRNLCHDGRTLYLIEGGEGHSGDLWVADLSRKSMSKLTFGQRGIASSACYKGGVVYSRIEQGKTVLRRIPNGATGPGTELLSVPTSLIGKVAEITQDGNTAIVSIQDPKTGMDLYIAHIGEQRSATPLINSPADQLGPALSPDGRLLSYVSNESGRPEVYVTSFPDGVSRTQVSQNGGFYTFWDSNSNLFYVAAGGVIMQVTLHRTPRLASDTPKQIAKVDVQTADAVIPKPDGKSFILLRPAGTENAAPEPLTLVMNWQQQFKKQ